MGDKPRNYWNSIRLDYFHLVVTNYLKVDDSYVELLSSVSEQTSRGQNVIIAPGVFGEHFFDNIEQHPSRIFTLRNIPPSEELLSEFPQSSIALHFRGQDFAEWNKASIMEPEFYISALEHFNLEHYSVYIFTDDPTHPTVTVLKSKLPRAVLITSSSMSATFLLLSKFQNIVASPSTFAFWAAILGEPSNFFISSDWITLMERNGDLFWPTLAMNTAKLLPSVNVI